MGRGDGEDGGPISKSVPRWKLSKALDEVLNHKFHSYKISIRFNERKLR
jgi:hypothetical protein